MSTGGKILKYSGWTLLCIAGLLIISLMLLNLAIRPRNVQNLVERYSKEYINAEINADTIEIHLLRNFPYASLSIKNCTVRSLAFSSLDSARRELVPAKADSLANIGRLNVSVSLVDLLLGRITIRGVELESPQIYAYISQFGINNWDILKMESDSTQTQDSTSLEVKIKKISIEKGAQIALYSMPDSINMALSLREILLRGRISTRLDDNFITKARISRMVLSAMHFNNTAIDSTLDNSLKISIDSLDISKKQKSNKASVDIRMRTDFRFHGITMASNIPFEMRGGIELKDLDKERLGINLENLTIYAATLPVTMDGHLVVTNSGIEIPDLHGFIDKYNIKNLLEYIPDKFLKKGKFETDAAITLRTRINGKYSFATGELPTVDLALAIPPSTLTVYGKDRNRNDTLKNIEADINLHFNQSDVKSNIFRISKLSVEGRGISYNINGRVDEYIADPLISLNLKCALNLDTLSAILPIKEKMVARGSINGDFSLQGRVSTLNLFSLNRNNINGELTSDSLRFIIPQQGIDFNCGKVGLHAGVLKNSTDTLLTSGSRIFNVGLNLDTLYLNYKDSMLISGSKVALTANQEPPEAGKEKSAKNRNHTTDSQQKRRGIIPPSLKIDGKINIRGVTIMDTDSTRIRLRGAEGAFSITPWTDGKTPVIALNAGFKGINIAENGSRFFARNSNFAVKAVAHSPKRRIADTTARNGNKAGMLHAAKGKTPADSTGKPAFNAQRFARTVLKYWDISGNIKSAGGRVITPAFPLRTRFSNFDLTLSNDGMHFHDTKFKIGRSSITLSGRLQGFANAVTQHQKLTFTGNISADTLDIDQLMQASANSKDVSMVADTRSDETIENDIQKAQASDTSTIIKAPLVPDFLEADINVNLNNVTFNSSVMKSIKGNLMAHNSIFLLSRFKVGTESGEVDLNAFYAAGKTDDISIGFDMRMNRFEVADLVEFIPEVDTLFPMLRSFKGKITCKLSAMSKVDSLLNMKMESINGVASLEGENVVLLDGETFAEIAKKLKFKNREKNLIDKISVQCVAADNKIEIFPFVLQMDRYKAAISGTQNMDMSFKYHISVLKSPIPFRIGLNISGKVDKMKFGIGKCLYKNENVPVYTEVLDSARVNLSQQIKSIFLNGVEKTMQKGSTAELAKSAQDEQSKTNNMEELSQSELRQLDSTNVDKPEN